MADEKPPLLVLQLPQIMLEESLDRSLAAVGRRIWDTTKDPSQLEGNILCLAQYDMKIITLLRRMFLGIPFVPRDAEELRSVLSFEHPAVYTEAERRGAPRGVYIDRLIDNSGGLHDELIQGLHQYFTVCRVRSAKLDTNEMMPYFLQLPPELPRD